MFVLPQIRASLSSRHSANVMQMISGILKLAWQATRRGSRLGFHCGDHTSSCWIRHRNTAQSPYTGSPFAHELGRYHAFHKNISANIHQLVHSPAHATFLLLFLPLVFLFALDALAIIFSFTFFALTLHAFHRSFRSNSLTSTPFRSPMRPIS